MSETFPFIREAVRFLPVASCARWGAITHKADGSPDFHAVLSHEGAAKAVLFAFDLLELEGQDLRPSVLEECWVLLGEVLFEPREGLKVVAQCEGNGTAHFRYACALDLHGIVTKRLEAPDRSLACVAQDENRGDSRL